MINQTVDVDTLDSWCQATQKDSYLHEVAMSARWRTVTIDDRDLLPAPGDDEEFFDNIQKKLRKYNLGKHWKPAGEMVNTLLRASKGSCRCSANYVQDLVFDFRLLRYYEDDDINDWWEDMEPLSDDDEETEIPPYTAWDLVPTVYSLRHTLAILNGHFPNLRHISCHGDTPRAVLDFVNSQRTVKIRSLEIRSLGAFARLQENYEDQSPDLPLRRWPLRLEEMSGLRQLQALSISRLSCRETAGLLIALPNLSELKRLTLVCEEKEHGESRSICALKSLFEQVLQGCETADTHIKPGARYSRCFPPSLESLSLKDTSADCHPVTMPPIKPLRLGDNLTHLCADIGDIEWIPSLVDCFSKSSLRSLWVPGWARGGFKSRRDDHTHIKHAIAKHEGSLGIIRLLRAWDTDRAWIDELNDKYQGKYAVQELVLGTNNVDWHMWPESSVREKNPVITLQYYLCGLRWKAPGDIGRWGHEIRRIRIDVVGLSDPDLDVSAISAPFYSHLKILMLQPAYREMHGSGSVPEPHTINSTAGIELAERIVTHGAQSLRVIVIATHWYWISTDPMKAGQNKILWTWADAVCDPVQRESMSSVLGKADMAFLEPSTVPYWHERDTIEWHRNTAHRRLKSWYEPSKEMMDQWNYLTMLPLDEN